MNIFGKILFEYLLCYLAQCFIIVLGVFAFCKRRLDFKHYIFGVAMIFAGSIVVRNLPISYGVHTLFIMLITALVSVWYLKFPINLSIRSALFMTLILFVGEIGNIFFLNILLGKDRFVEVINDTSTKFVYAIPATIIALLITLIYYMTISRSPAMKEQKKETEKPGGERKWTDI